MAMNSTAACVLGLLDIGPPPPARSRWDADGTMSAAEIWDSVERSVGGFWSLTRSQVYAEVKRLVADDLVEADEGRYRLTPAGRSAVQEWFLAFALGEPRDDSVRSPITLTVFFGHYLPSELLERVVREQELRYRRRLDSLNAIADALHGDRSLPGSTLQRAIHMTRGNIEWTRDVIHRVAPEAPTASRRATKRGARRA